MELYCKMEINAPKEKIWPYYGDPAKHSVWEEDLESLSFDGDVKTETTGKMKLKGMPEMPFILTKVVPNASYWGRTEVPGMGHIDFGHDIISEGNRIYIGHTVRLEKDDFSQEDLEFLRGVFSDVPNAVLKIKQEAEK